jgi:hypothetical protein
MIPKYDGSTASVTIPKASTESTSTTGKGPLSVPDGVVRERRVAFLAESVVMSAHSQVLSVPLDSECETNEMFARSALLKVVPVRLRYTLKRAAGLPGLVPLSVPMTSCLFGDICPWKVELPLTPLSLTTPVVEIVQMTAPGGSTVVLPVLSRYEVNVSPPELSIVTATCLQPEEMPIPKIMVSQVPVASVCENVTVALIWIVTEAVPPVRSIVASPR